MRSGTASSMDYAAQQIEDILRPFNQRQRLNIIDISGKMLNADDEDALRREQENASNRAYVSGEAARANS